MIYEIRLFGIRTAGAMVAIMPPATGDPNLESSQCPH